jgi:hypothetical protein
VAIAENMILFREELIDGRKGLMGLSLRNI